jgi:hypothetical protein
MESSKEESMMMADLVGLSHVVFQLLLESIGDSKGYIYCLVRWHKEPKGGCPRLDNPMGHSIASTPLTEHQDQLRLPPSHYGRPSLCPAGFSWNEAEFVQLPIDVYPPDSVNYSVREKLSTGEITVCGGQWPMLVYVNWQYDKNESWEGLFRSQLLVWVEINLFLFVFSSYSQYWTQVFKHIFTSPSSVEKETKATRSGNTHIHGMTQVTTASLAYVATQVCPVFKFDQFSAESHRALFCTIVFICVL